MEKFLVLHTRYKDLQIGYFEDSKLLELITIDSVEVNKRLLVTLNSIFSTFDVTLNKLSFIAAHTGPAPYTTLRVTLSTLNGISYGENIPLIGINGLEPFLFSLNQDSSAVILLNAFGNDLYYAASSLGSHSYLIGADNIDSLFRKLSTKISKPIQFYGNAGHMFKLKIKEAFGEDSIINDQEIIPIKLLAQEALKLWEAKQICSELFPIYLK